jgi:hypothetical protein
MNRSLPRNLCVVATVLTLAFVTIPVASAQPSKAPSYHVPASWFEVALTWIGRLPVLRGQGPADRGVQQKGKDDRVSAYTGVCIDPDGNRVPCPGV